MGGYTQRVRKIILPAFNDETPADRIRPLISRRQHSLSRGDRRCICYLVTLRPSAVIGGNIAL